MKRFLNYYLSMTLIASLFLVTSCGEDAEDDLIDAPVLEIVGTEEGEETAATVDAGEEVAFTVNVNAPGGFNTFIVNKTVGDGETEEIVNEARTPGSTQEDFTYLFQYTPTAAEAGQDIVFDFIAVDDNARERSITYTITVNEQLVNVFPAVLLYAPDAEGNTETFFSATTGETYSSGEVTSTAEAVSPLIDFGYFYGETMEATIASPANFPFEVGQSGWNTRNDTQLRLTDMDQSAFNEANSSAVINAAFDEAESGSNPGQVSNLQVGSVIAFETDATEELGPRRGLIYVEEIDPGFGNEDFIRILVKVVE